MISTMLRCAVALREVQRCAAVSSRRGLGDRLVSGSKLEGSRVNPPRA